MNRHVLYTVFLLSWCVSFAHAQFEGTIEMKMTMSDNGKTQEMLYDISFKDNMTAMMSKAKDKDMMMPGKMIYRGDKQVMWMINDEEKSYLEISLKDQDGMEDEEEKEMTKDRPKIRKTGKTQTILGYSCDEWIEEDDNEVTSIWGTPKLGNIYESFTKSFSGMSGGKARKESKGWENEMFSNKVFPLKVVVSEKGKVKHSQEVTKIEAKKIPASMFNVPKDYEKQSLDFDMQKMMKDAQKMMEKHKRGEKESEEEKDTTDDD